MPRGRIATAMDQIVTQQERLNEAKASLIHVNQILTIESQRDPFPVTFAGLADNYRFTTGAKGETPTHRFEVKCGNGIFLHIEASPPQFAAMMVDMDMGEIKPSKVNGKIIIAARSLEKGTVPVRMVEGEVFSVKDLWGNYLWPGAKVRLVKSGEEGVIPTSARPTIAETPYIAVNILGEEGAADRTTEKYFRDLVLNL